MQKLAAEAQNKAKEEKKSVVHSDHIRAVSKVCTKFNFFFNLSIKIKNLNLYLNMLLKVYIGLLQFCPAQLVTYYYSTSQTNLILYMYFESLVFSEILLKIKYGPSAKCYSQMSCVCGAY